MTDGQQHLVRCGLDLEHESHEHPRGWCDGGITATAGGPAAVGPLEAMFKGIVAEPRPWAWGELTVDQAELLVEQLDRFAEHYNATYVVDERQLLLGCWPLHPGVAAELAPLYAQWVFAHQAGMSSAETSLAWHDRWLVGFQQRLPGWFGLNGQGCRPGWHKADWNPSAALRAEAAKRPEGVELGDAVRALTDNPARIGA